VPIVVTGFEPLDLLDGIRRAVVQLESRPHEVENAYERVVTFEGNQPAQKLLPRSLKSPIAPGAASASFPKAAGGSTPTIATSTPKSASTSPAFTPRSRRCAAPATCCAEPSSRPSARPSARNARRAIRSARPWFQAKAPAPPTTTTGASCRPKSWPAPVPRFRSLRMAETPKVRHPISPTGPARCRWPTIPPS
jgi:hypothetical protein